MGSSPSFLSRQKKSCRLFGLNDIFKFDSVSFQGGQIYKEITVQSLKMLGRVSKWRDNAQKKIKKIDGFPFLKMDASKMFMIISKKLGIFSGVGSES